MKKTAAGGARPKVRELEPRDTRKIDLTRFKPNFSAKDWKEIFKPGRISPSAVFFFPIETLSPTKTIGMGRTNLTIIMPTIVQTDATTPYAGFDRRATPSRDPGIQMHFEPGAYGNTSVSTYVMMFTIEVAGQSTFNLSGYAGPGTLSGTGSKVLSGQQVVSLIFKNVPASQQVYGYLEQTAGGSWSWFATRVTFPPLVLTV